MSSVFPDGEDVSGQPYPLSANIVLLDTGNVGKKKSTEVFSLKKNNKTKQNLKSSVLSPGVLLLPDPVCRYLGDKKGPGAEVDGLWAGCTGVRVAQPHTKRGGLHTALLLFALNQQVPISAPKCC